MAFNRASPLSAPVSLGVDLLFEEYLDLIKGKRVGLITNPTGVDENVRFAPKLEMCFPFGPTMSDFKVCLCSW